MITTILWDVDGTLLDFEYSQKLSLRQCFETIGMEMTEEMHTRYAQINDSYWKRLELGEVTKAQLLNGRFIDLFAEFGIENVDVESFRREYQAALGNIYAYVDGALEICRELQGQVKQYVITNGVSATQRNKLELSGLAACMDGLFISEEVGEPKPNTGFFEKVLAQVEEKDKSRIIVVGDSLSSDIKGGVMAGLKTCWFRREGCVNSTPYQSDYEISELHQIFEILRKS